MQPGISQLVLPKLSTPDFLEQAADAGYEVVELALRKEGDLTLDTPEAALKDFAGQARDRGLTIFGMTHSQCTGNLLDSGEAQRTSIEQTRRGLHVARTLGASCTLHTLGKLRPDLFYDDAYRNGVDSLRQLARTCEELNINLAVEFIWSGFLFSPLEFKRFLEEVGSPRVGFYFDPGNMAIFQFPQHWARILGRHIQGVHMKDWKGRALNGGWPALLEGEVDYAAINRELRAAGYDGPMISEVPPEVASLEKTAASIRKIIAV